MNPEYCSEPKKMKEVKMKNKIIISILKLINPNIPTNSQIKEFMNPENEKKQINDNFYKIGKFPLKCLEEIGSSRRNKIINNFQIKNKINYKEEKNNLLGIINLIALLKENKELTEKLNQIKNKVLLIFEQKLNANNNYLNNNMNNNITNNTKILVVFR